MPKQRKVEILNKKKKEKKIYLNKFSKMSG